MSDEQWSKRGVFDPALVRQEVDEPIRIERPIDVETPRAISPPVPAEFVIANVPLDTAQLAELWRQIDANDNNQPDTRPADQPVEDSAAQLGLVMYLLQTLHAQGKPGFEHLVRSDPKDQEDDEEDDQEISR